MRHDFTALFEPTDDGWSAYALEYPNVIATGATQEEARENLKPLMVNLFAKHHEILQDKIEHNVHERMTIDVPDNTYLLSIADIQRGVVRKVNNYRKHHFQHPKIAESNENITQKYDLVVGNINR